MKHLWEVKHDYFINALDGRYHNYNVFEDFVADFSGDQDHNFVYRWDWYEGEDWGLQQFNGDPSIRNGILVVAFVLQRLGRLAVAKVKVSRNDESAVIQFLRPRYTNVTQIWQPFSQQESTNDK